MNLLIAGKRKITFVAYATELNLTEFFKDIFNIVLDKFFNNNSCTFGRKNESVRNFIKGTIACVVLCGYTRVFKEKTEL
jgi:hypothetical protein